MFLLRVDEEVTLTDCAPSHAGELFALIDANRAHLRRWLPWLDDTVRLQQIEQFLRESRRKAEMGNGRTLMLMVNRRIAGVIGQHYIDRVDAKTELGYWLAADQQGRGLMTRAIARVLVHVFDDLELHRVVLQCGAENAKSRAIPERLGFTLEGVSRQSQWLYDRYIDLAVYSLLEPDWRRVAKPLADTPPSSRSSPL